MAVLLHGLYDFSIITVPGNIRYAVPAVIVITLVFLVFSGFSKVKKMKSVSKIK